MPGADKKGGGSRTPSNLSQSSHKHGDSRRGSKSSRRGSNASKTSKTGKSSPEPIRNVPPREHTMDLSENDKYAKDAEEREKERSETPEAIEEREERNKEINDRERDAEERDQNQDGTEDNDRDNGDRLETTNEDEEPADYRPEDFDPKAFLVKVDRLSDKLNGQEYRSLDGIDGDELNGMVKEVSVTMYQLQAYSEFAQGRLEKLRDQLKEIKDRMYKRVNTRMYDTQNANQRMSLEERQQEAKIAQLNKELARAAEELVRAGQTSAETETGALVAAEAAEKAAEEAKQIQAEYEARRRAEAEARAVEEEKRAVEEKRRQEIEKREEEVRRAEEARRARLKGIKVEDDKPKEWEAWPMAEYGKDASEFDGGLSCIIRGNPSSFNQSDVEVRPMSPMETEFPCDQNEELVGNIICITSQSGETKLKNPVQLLMPHCTSRASGMSREPVVKGWLHGNKAWKELRSYEVNLDGHKDVKFVQAEIEECGNYAVVTKMKQDFLTFGKRGGRIVSQVDSRVTFEVQKGTFTSKENFVMQLQPVDSSTLSDIRRTAEGKGLLSSSAIVELEFTSKEFIQPIQMSLPCPPNPVKAKKAAAARAAKLEKMKKPPPNPVDVEEERQRRKEAEKKKKEEARMAAIAAAQSTDSEDKPKQQTKWYMGQYGTNDDDESEVIYFIKKTPGGRWVVLEHMAIIQPRLDLLQFALYEPIKTFMVLRARPDVDIDGAQKIAEMIEKHLTERMVTVILKQRSDSGVECCMSVVATNKKDKHMRLLEEEGYDEGPGASADIIMREGDLLEVTFRGNIQCAQQESKLDMVFSSQLPCSAYFEIEEVNKFLQRNYPNFRGFVMLTRKTPIKKPPQPKDKKEDEVEEEEAVEYEREVLCEHLVTVPKEIEQSQQVTRYPVKISNKDGPITDDTLRHLAYELGDEWQKVAHHLNVKRMRIQAILRNNVSNSEEDVKYDMLMSWIKRVPRSVNKVEVLCSALHLSNRTDLAKELRDQADNWRERKANPSRPASRPASRPMSAASRRGQENN